MLVIQVRTVLFPLTSSLGSYHSTKFFQTPTSPHSCPALDASENVTESATTSTLPVLSMPWLPWPQHKNEGRWLKAKKLSCQKMLAPHTTSNIPRIFSSRSYSTMTKIKLKVTKLFGSIPSSQVLQQ